MGRKFVILNMKNSKLLFDFVKIRIKIIMVYRDFHELPIWQVGFRLLMKIYDYTDMFSKSENFALISQIRRSGNSIIANIVEA